MNKKDVIKYIIAIFLLVFGFSSCKNHDNEYHSLMDKIEAESLDTDNNSFNIEKKDVEIETIEITERKHRFLIPERKSQIESYTCTECHTKPLDQLKNKGDSKNAHWDIKLKHADETIMNCISCHNTKDMNTLKSLTGNPIDFNYSYKQCNQCHSNQFKDWTGGAHGKNIGGWTSPRISMTCVNCHNPHQPQIQSKWPARFNTKIELQRK